MDGPVIEPSVTLIIEPSECVLEPIFVVSLWKVFPRMGTATFRPPDCGMKTGTRLSEHIVEFERFAEIRVENHRAIHEPKVSAHHFDDFVELAQTVFQQRAIAEDGAVTLHDPLHRQSDRARLGSAF
jgi:hypothetical protein